ncbi:MAG TPA: hypothetical protein VEC57_16835 [Candidatus Limnocylindrales bacterium]|nr:hypothetical protein [Candidatus Limnocylindrales bacterium]
MLMPLCPARLRIALAIFACVAASATPAHAVIVADSASDVCAAAADPCIVSQEVDVVDGSILDFGTRTVQIQGSGVFDFDTGDGVISCGSLVAAVSGNAIKARGNADGGGSAGGAIEVQARRRCSLDSSVTCFVHADCAAASAGQCTSGTGTVSLDGRILGNADVPARVTVRAAGEIEILGQITVAATSSESDGGSISIYSELGSILIDDSVSATGGAFGSGGVVVLQAGADVDVDAVIDVNGGDFDGGVVTIFAAGNVSITEDITANATSGAGFGGEIDVQAGGDLAIVGGGSSNRLNLSTEGHQSSDNFAGDGGLQSYEAGGAIDVSQYVRFEANGSPPDGFGELISFFSGEETTIAGQIISKAKGGQGGGGNVELASDGAITLTSTASIDVTGQASGGGEVRLDAAGDLDVSGTIDASGGNGGVAGRVLAESAANASVGGTLLASGTSSSFSHGELVVEACRVVVTGTLNNSGDAGENLLVGRERITVASTGSVLASGAGASNTFQYRDSAKPPVVQGTVSPSPILVVDPTLEGCPVCGNAEIDQGESCDDGGLQSGDGCNSSCEDEGCIAQTPGYPGVALCDDGNQCTDDACDAVAHACTHTGNDCSDGIACTTDACAGNVCTHVPVSAQCDDSNPCTADTCSTSVGCVHPPQESTCDDGVFCNGSDSCSGGTCSMHAGDPCAGGAECADVCDEDADACRTPAGVGCSDDGNACSDDVCDGLGACTHPANAAPCNDGLFCNGADTCAGGTCSQHAGDPCAGGGECSNACSESGDHCLASGGTACSDDANVCTDDACDGAGTCSHDANAAPCDDLNFCTIDDVCSGGSCVATPAPLLDVAALKVQLQPYDDDDRMGLKAAFPISALPDSPVDGGMRIVVSDDDGRVVFEAAVPPGAFEGSADGSVFRFKAESPADAGGIAKASLKATAASGEVKVRVKIASVDLTEVRASERLATAILFGDDPGSSPCTGSALLDCAGAATKISCASP